MRDASQVISPSGCLPPNPVGILVGRWLESHSPDHYTGGKSDHSSEIGAKQQQVLWYFATSTA
jgi:hypothetical protein